MCRKMARRPRYAIPELPRHVLVQGNNHCGYCRLKLTLATHTLGEYERMQSLRAGYFSSNHPPRRLTAGFTDVVRASPG